MRILKLIGAMLALTACGRPFPPGVPFDWGLDWMPMVKLEIHESTCDGVDRPLMTYVNISAPLGGRRNHNGTYFLALSMQDDIHPGGRGPGGRCISAPEPTDEGYALDCPTIDWIIAPNPVSLLDHDYADWTRHGFFAGPSSVVLHHDLQVRDCHHLTECAEYTANCTMRYTTWFGDWDD